MPASRASRRAAASASHWARVSLPAGRSGWMRAAQQGLVGVDVPHAGDAALVEQEGLDRSATAARELAQVARGEALIEGLEPKAGGEEALELIGPLEQLARAEAARVDDEQPVAGPPRELDPDARVDRLWSGSQRMVPVMRRCWAR